VEVEGKVEEGHSRRLPLSPPSPASVRTYLLGRSTTRTSIGGPSRRRCGALRDEGEAAPAVAYHWMTGPAVTSHWSAGTKSALHSQSMVAVVAANREHQVPVNRIEPLTTMKTLMVVVMEAYHWTTGATAASHWSAGTSSALHSQATVAAVVVTAHWETGLAATCHWSADTSSAPHSQQAVAAAAGAVVGAATRAGTHAGTAWAGSRDSSGNPSSSRTWGVH